MVHLLWFVVVRTSWLVVEHLGNPSSENLTVFEIDFEIDIPNKSLCDRYYIIWYGEMI